LTSHQVRQFFVYTSATNIVLFIIKSDETDEKEKVPSQYEGRH
jgi:hypothetical protein